MILCSIPAKQQSSVDESDECVTQIMKYLIRSLKPTSAIFKKPFASMKTDIKIYLEKFAFPSLLKNSPASINIPPTTARAARNLISEVQQTVRALKEKKTAEANTQDDLKKKIDLLSRKLCSSMKKLMNSFNFITNFF